MAGRGRPQTDTSRLEDMKSQQELRMRKDAMAYTRGLEEMTPMRTMTEQKQCGLNSMIAWFVPRCCFRPGALTMSEMRATTPEEQTMKISHAFLLALASQPASGRISGRLADGHFSTSLLACDSRGIKGDNVTVDMYNSSETVVVWLTSDAVDANVGLREAGIAAGRYTAEQALEKWPPLWSPAAMTRDNVVGGLFISTLRDPEASFSRAVEMTVRENQMIRDQVRVSDREMASITQMCNAVSQSGVSAGFSTSYLFSLLFHPRHHRHAIVRSAHEELDRRAQISANKLLDGWLMAQQEKEPDDREDTSEANIEIKRHSFFTHQKGKIKRESIPEWKLATDLGYAPSESLLEGDLPESLMSIQRLLRDRMLLTNQRRLPAEVEVDARPGYNPAETGAHARAWINSVSSYVGMVLGLFGEQKSDSLVGMANHVDEMMRHTGIDLPTQLDPCRHLTLDHALKRAAECGVAPGLCKLSHFLTADGVLFTPDIAAAFIRSPLVGPNAVERPQMTRRDGSDLDAVPLVDDVVAYGEGDNPIPDSRGLFRLMLAWPSHTTILPHGKELFEDNESAQFPDTIDNFPDRLNEAIEAATGRIADISQIKVDSIQTRLIDYVIRAYNMLVNGEKDDVLSTDPSDVRGMRDQTVFMQFNAAIADGNTMSDKEFYSRFASMMSTEPALLKKMIESYRRAQTRAYATYGRSSLSPSLSTSSSDIQDVSKSYCSRSTYEVEQWYKRIRTSSDFVKIKAFNRANSESSAASQVRIVRAATHQLYNDLLPLSEKMRLLMVIDPEAWRAMCMQQRQYCSDLFSRVYYADKPANGLALRAIKNWETACYTGVALGSMAVGSNMSLFGSFIATTLALNCSIAGMTNSPHIGVTLLLVRGTPFRMSSKMGFHPIICGPAALGKTTTCSQVGAMSIPGTHHAGGTGSAKANKDNGAIQLAFSTRTVDEPSKALTHGARQGTDRDSDTEFNDLKRLLGDSSICYERSVHGQGTEQINIELRIDMWITCNDYLCPKENSLASRVCPIMCESGDQQGVHNTLIVRTLQPPKTRVNSSMSALRSRWRHHQHWVALMTQIADCGGALPAGTLLLSVLSTKVFQRVGGLIPGAASYPRIGIMAMAKAIQFCYTRSFYIYCQTNGDAVQSEWREGVSVSGVDDAADGGADAFDMSDDPENDEIQPGDLRGRKANRNPFETGVDWVTTVGRDAGRLRRQFDISVINHTSPHAVLTSEIAMFVLTQMMDELFPVHLHAALTTLALGKCGWFLGALDFLMGKDRRDYDMSMFSDTESGVVRLETAETEDGSEVRVLRTFGRTKEAFGRIQMPIFWTREEEYEQATQNSLGCNKSQLLEKVSWATSDDFYDFNYVQTIFRPNDIESFLQSAMSNTQNPTMQALQYILSYCRNGHCNIIVPALARVPKSDLKEDTRIDRSHFKFVELPSKTNGLTKSVLMHSIPAVKVISDGAQRRIYISTMFLMLGAERFRTMNMYAMLEDDFMRDATRMVIPRAVPGQCTLYQVIVLNRRPGVYLSLPHPLGEEGADHTLGGITGIAAPVDIPFSLPEGINIRAALAPMVTSSVKNSARQMIADRIGNWKYVEPLQRVDGVLETAQEYEKRNSVVLARNNNERLVFDARSVEDDCALAHLQLHGFRYNDAVKFLPSSTERAMNSRAALLSVFDSSAIFSGDVPTLDESRANLQNINIGSKENPLTVSLDELRAYQAWFSATGHLLYPDHFINNTENFDSETTDMSTTTMRDLIAGRVTSIRTAKSQLIGSADTSDESLDNRGKRRFSYAENALVSAEDADEDDAGEFAEEANLMCTI